MVIFALLQWSGTESTISPRYACTFSALPPPSLSSLTLTLAVVPFLQQLSSKACYTKRMQDKPFKFKTDLCATLPFLTLLVNVLNPYSAIKYVLLIIIKMKDIESLKTYISLEVVNVN